MLQRNLGNQAMQQLLQSGAIQPKLTIGQPDDVYEQEADRVAEQVMRMPEPLRHDPSNSSGEGIFQAKEVPGETPAPFPAVESYANTLQGGGQPLPDAVRAFFEPRFGYAFNQVRIHTDARAAESAGAVNALAFTLGRHIVFGPGQFAPETGAGRKLLAHELAHVVQQAGGNQERIARVPKRDDIDGTYCFSANCGWIDWSHADPSLSANLIKRVQQASDALKSAGTNATASTGELSSPTMTSGAAGIVVHSANMRVKLLRPLSADEVLSVSLSLFKKLSVAFETQQELTDLIRESSFAQEDLPSNLMGFYMAAKGYTQDQIKQYCGALDKAASVQEYDNNHDFKKNRTFSPIGATGSWPKELSDIDDTPASNLYEILRVSVNSGGAAYTFCPLYRVEGLIDEIDLGIIGIGGTRFAATDNLRVVPTYRPVLEHTGQGTKIQVEPYGNADIGTFNSHKIKWPIYIPESALVCLSSQGNPI